MRRSELSKQSPPSLGKVLVFLNRSSEETGCVGTVTVQDGVSICYTGTCERSVQRPRSLGSRGDSEGRSLEEAARTMYGNCLMRQKDPCASASDKNLPTRAQGCGCYCVRGPRTSRCYLETAQSFCASRQSNVSASCFIKNMGGDSIQDPEPRGEQRAQP